jgi:RNA polymerase sigma-70 factor (ECF subfamily)
LHENEETGKNYRAAINQIADKLPEPAQQAEYAEQKILVSHLLTYLPDNQKEVIVLHDLEGFSYQQISALTGVSVGTVRSRLYYGRGKLKDILVLYTKRNARRKKRLRFNP